MAIPRSYCDPPESFGQVDQGDQKVPPRVWIPPNPNDATAVAKFRAAVMQNVICCRVRLHKNDTGLPQAELIRRDTRPDAATQWRARLNGRANLTTQDIVTLMMVLPGAMPREGEIKEFIEVVEKHREPPENWRWTDR